MIPRILIVGAGSIGERHVRCFLASDRCAVGICETHQPVLNDVAKRYPVCGSFADLERALTEPWDAAVIATPAHTHIPLATRCAKAGLHLLIEKPLAVRPQGIDALEKLIQERQLIVAMAYVTRNHPALAAMRDALCAGRFGKPLQVIVTSGQHFPFFRPAYRETYYVDHERGGGAIQDGLTHMYDAVSWLVGPITRLAADAKHQALPGVEVEDTVQVIARHDEVLASYTFNQFQAPNETAISVHCESGSARFEYHTNRWSWMTEHNGKWNDEPSVDIKRDTLFTSQAHAFLDSVAGIRSPLCTLAEGHHSLRAARATLMSAGANGEPQVLSPGGSS